MTAYDEFANHPLRGVPQAVLDVARKVLAEAVVTKDVDAEQADPIADAVVLAMKEAGYLRTRAGGGGPVTDDERTAGERWGDEKVREAEEALMSIYLLRYGIGPDVVAAELAAIKERAGGIR